MNRNTIPSKVLLPGIVRGRVKVCRRSKNCAPVKSAVAEFGCGRVKVCQRDSKPDPVKTNTKYCCILALSRNNCYLRKA